jgi:hypothetical protein
VPEAYQQQARFYTDLEEGYKGVMLRRVTDLSPSPRTKRIIANASTPR